MCYAQIWLCATDTQANSYGHQTHIVTFLKDWYQKQQTANTEEADWEEQDDIQVYRWRVSL